MVRITVEESFDSSKKYIKAFGLSTDDKPITGIITGSCFNEVDTGKAYLFNETASAWVEQSGGGGTGGSNVLVVNLTIDGATATADKTWKEIYDAPYAVVSMEMGANNKSFFNIANMNDESDEYHVRCVQPGLTDSDTMVLTALTETDYPSITMGG